jgi:hypothetical protein
VLRHWEHEPAHEAALSIHNEVLRIDHALGEQRPMMRGAHEQEVASGTDW